jgi:hypothetical protein
LRNPLSALGSVAATSEVGIGSRHLPRLFAFALPPIVDDESRRDCCLVVKQWPVPVAVLVTCRLLAISRPRWVLAGLVVDLRIRTSMLILSLPHRIRTSQAASKQLSGLLSHLTTVHPSPNPADGSIRRDTEDRPDHLRDVERRVTLSPTRSQREVVIRGNKAALGLRPPRHTWISQTQIRHSVNPCTPFPRSLSCIFRLNKALQLPAT